MIRDPRARATGLALPCLFAALSAAGGFIALPLPGSPVPIVIQNLMVVLAGLLLGPVQGAFSVLLFLGLGALGFPVFSGGHGGLAWFAGPTGGYLVGYVFAALLAGFISKRREPVRAFIASFSSFALILFFGVIRLKMLKNVEWSQALILGLLPFIPGDGAKAIVAALLSWRLGPFLDAISGRPSESPPR